MKLNKLRGWDRMSLEAQQLIYASLPWHKRLLNKKPK